MSEVYKYAGYQIVEESEEFEYRHYYVYMGAHLIQHYLRRRSVHTITWEATLQDGGIPEASATYNHEQGYPGSVNPGNLSEGSGWKLQSVEYTRSLSVPMSKDVRETWCKNGAWEDVYDYIHSRSL